VRLSVVIPTFRRHDVLGRTLAALDRQDGSAGEFEVIVIADPVEDDPDAVRAVVSAERRPYPARSLDTHARGVSAARNVGYRAARAPLVLFLGDDIIPSPRLVAEHLDWHERRGGPRTGVLGHVKWARELGLTPFMRWLDHGVQFDYPAIGGERTSWEYFYAANASLPRALLEEAGGFDEERFPFLYEELDVAYRMGQHGFELLYNRKAVAEHAHPVRMDEWRSRMAATAAAERRWVELHPEMPAYFHDKFADAAAHRRSRGIGRAALGWLPRRVPVLGPRAWSSADLYYRQQLGPAFLDAWAQLDGERSANSGGSSPGGPK
jgi:GT2 family glycosyltransferase